MKCERCKGGTVGMIHVECEGYVCASCLLSERLELRTEVERLKDALECAGICPNCLYHNPCMCQKQRESAQA